MNRFITSLKENIFTAGKIIVLVAICLISGFIISYPFWKFAETSPKIYTVCVLTLMAGSALYYAVKTFRAMSVKKVIKLILNFLIILLGAAGIVVLVLNEYRFFSLLLLIAVSFLCFLTNMLLYEKKSD